MAMEQPKPTKELENERNREQEKKKSQEKLLEAKVQELLNEADKHLKDYDTKSALLIMNQIQALLGIKTKEEKEYDESSRQASLSSFVGVSMQPARRARARSGARIAGRN